jgi:hypothetical protein
MLQFDNKADFGESTIGVGTNYVLITGRRYRRSTIFDPHTLECKATDINGAVWVLDEQIFNSNDASDPTSELSIRRTIEAAYKLGRHYHHTAPLMYSQNGQLIATTSLFIDPHADRFETVADRAVFDKFFDDEYATDEHYENVKEDIQTFNALSKAIDWYNACIGDKSAWDLRLNGLKSYRIFGHKQLLAGQIVRVRGFAASTHIAESVTFAPHPTRGPEFSLVTMNLKTALAGDIQVGYGFGARHFEDIDLESTDVSKLNGAFRFDSISDDRKEVTFTMWDKDQDAASLLSPGTYINNVGRIDAIDRCSIYVIRSQLMVTGGYDHREEESIIWASGGSQFIETGLAWVDCVEEHKVDYRGYSPDRKGFFTSHGANHQSTGSVYVGFNGRSFRFAANATGWFKLVHAGSVSDDFVCKRGVDLQLHSSLFGVKCFMGGYTHAAAISGGQSDLTLQNGVLANSMIGGNTISTSTLNLQANHVTHCSIPVLAQRKCTAYLDKDTLLKSCGHMQWRSEGFIVGLPTFINTPVEAQAGQNVQHNGGAWITGDIDLAEPA